MDLLAVIVLVIILILLLLLCMCMCYYKNSDVCKNSPRQAPPRRLPPPRIPPRIPPQQRPALYPPIKDNVISNPRDLANECVICLELFDAGEKISIIDCGHYFHQTCIDEWEKNCPKCRSSILV